MLFSASIEFYVNLFVNDDNLLDEQCVGILLPQVGDISRMWVSFVIKAVELPEV